jgi:hypothetical protein
LKFSNTEQGTQHKIAHTNMNQSQAEQGTQHKIAHTNMNQSQAYKFIPYAFALCMEIQPFRMHF